MPVEVLVGVLVVSVVANAALLLWLARADHVTVHWPLGKHDNEAADWPPRDATAGRRRALFVAGQSQPGASVRSGIPISTGAPGTGGASLPPDLADLLSRPASLGPHPDGHGSDGRMPDGRTPSNGHRDVASGFRPAAPDGMLVRMQTAPGGPNGISLDSLTGLEDQQSWGRIIEIENARLLRYRRPSTIVMAEVDGLRKLSERMGEDPVVRLLPVVADAFRSEARGSDWIARVGYGRFAAFLAETDEIAAINYVERIRQICEPWLSSAAVPLRLAIGWSSPSAASDLEYAIKRAEERMHTDRRIPAKLPAPRGAPQRVMALTGGDSGAEGLGPGFVSPAETGSLEPDEAEAGPPDPRVQH